MFMCSYLESGVRKVCLLAVIEIEFFFFVID